MTSVLRKPLPKLLPGLKIALPAPSSALRSKRKPHAYQKRGVEWLVSHAGAGLFADVGTGKTSIVQRALLAIKDAGLGGRALVVAPLRVAHEVWPVEADEWRGSEWDRLRTLKIVLLHGNDKEQRLQEDADIYVINFDGLKWLLSDAKKLRQLAVDTLVIDESSKLKHARTQRFKLIKPYLDRFARRWILTGSPNPNGYLDLFGQIYIIDQGAALGRFITHYRMNYFTPLDKFGWNWVLKPESEKAIQEKIAPYIFRLDASDYMELPALVENIIRVELPAQARKVYDEIEDDMITELEDAHTVIAASTGVAAMKCAQIANGGLYHMEEDGDRWGQRAWTNLHDEKTQAVLDVVDELQGSPCLVVYDLKHDLARLRAALGKDTPFIGGGVSPAASKQILADWNADKLPVLLVHPQTISHGLNMQKGTAHHIIWHSLTYDREQYDQLNGRLCRQGSRAKNIFVYHIVARDTTDEARLAALRKKGKVQQGFLDALREYAKKRRKT